MSRKGEQREPLTGNGDSAMCCYQAKQVRHSMQINLFGIAYVPHRNLKCGLEGGWYALDHIGFYSGGRLIHSIWFPDCSLQIDKEPTNITQCTVQVGHVPSMEKVIEFNVVLEGTTADEFSAILLH